MKNWRSKKMWKGCIILLFYFFTIPAFSNIDSLRKNGEFQSTNSFHTRIDIGFSIFQFMTNSFNPKHHQHFYLAVSKNSPNWNYTPSVGFMYSRSPSFKDSSYFGRKFGIFDYYLTVRFVKNNFPKKEKRNLYYGILFGGYYSYSGNGYSQIYTESKVLGLSVNPLLGFDQKLLKGFRFFCELQLGVVYQKISQKEFINNSLYRDLGKSNELVFFSYTPFLIGLSLLIN